jgi:hypothetical protein
MGFGEYLVHGAPISPQVLSKPKTAASSRLEEISKDLLPLQDSTYLPAAEFCQSEWRATLVGCPSSDKQTPGRHLPVVPRYGNSSAHN